MSFDRWGYWCKFSQWLAFVNLLLISEFTKMFWFRIFLPNCNFIFFCVFKLWFNRMFQPEIVKVIYLSTFAVAFVPILHVVSEPVKIFALNKFEHIWGPNLYDNLLTGINHLFCPVPNYIHYSFEPIEVKYCIKYHANTKTSVSFESRTIHVFLDCIGSSMCGIILRSASSMVYRLLCHICIECVE